MRFILYCNPCHFFEIREWISEISLSSDMNGKATLSESNRRSWFHWKKKAATKISMCDFHLLSLIIIPKEYSSLLSTAQVYNTPNQGFHTEDGETWKFLSRKSLPFNTGTISYKSHFHKYPSMSSYFWDYHFSSLFPCDALHFRQFPLLSISFRSCSVSIIINNIPKHEFTMCLVSGIMREISSRLFIILCP